MSAHRIPPNRRPLYVSLMVVGSSVVVVLAFGATAQNAAPIFKTGAADTSIAPPSVSPPTRPLISLPAPSPAPTAAVAATTRSKAAKPAVRASSHRQALATEVAADPARPASPAQPSAKPSKSKPGKHRATHPAPKHAANRSRRPAPHRTGSPAPHPTRRPAHSAGTGGTSLPWWWRLVPHPPTASPAPTAIHIPIPARTAASAPTTGGRGDGGRTGYGYRPVGRR